MIWITYERKQVSERVYEDPDDVDGLICNLPYSNPENAREFLAYFIDEDEVNLIEDYKMKQVVDVNALLNDWYGELVSFDGENIVDERPKYE